jgi:hypothetical protein
MPRRLEVPNAAGELEPASFAGAPPSSAAETLRAVARRFHEAVVVDEGGLAGREPALNLFQDASRNRALWIDAGARSVDEAADLFVAGASRVTLRWALLPGREALEDAVSISEGVYLGVEANGLGLRNNRRDRTPWASLAEALVGSGAGVVVLDEGPEGPSDGAKAAAEVFSAVGERWYFGTLAGDARTTAMIAEAGFTGAILPLPNVEPPPEEELA